MIQRISVLRRRPDMDPDRFRQYWRQVHGPLLRAVPGLLRYQQNPVVDAAQRVSHQRGATEVDGFAQLWFEDEAAMDEAAASAALQAAHADLPSFVRAMSLYACETNVVVDPGGTPPPAKRMTLLYARAGLASDKFRFHWFEEHADMVAGFPLIRGYAQHLVTRRLSVSVPGVADAGIDCAGILEMWFDTVADMDAAFASPKAKEAVAHGKVFLDAVTTYVTEEHRIIGPAA